MICIYCEKNEAIENSHIIPKFFYDWMKETAITPYLREINCPNQRLQDGLKVPLLCQICENKFSKFENKYKSHLFKKIVNYRKEMPEVLQISESDKVFYLSLVWRQLTNYLLYDDKKNQYPDEISLIASKAQQLKKWIEDTLEFQKKGYSSPIYIIPVKPNVLERLNFIPSANGIWYEYERSIAQDMRFWGKERINRIIIFIKLPFQIIICDLTNNKQGWDMPQLHSVNELRLDDINEVPDEVIALSYDMFNTKALESYKALSKNQKDKILNDVNKLSNLEDTGSYKSMSRHNQAD